MGNFKHYLKGISSGDSYFTLEKKLNFIIGCLAWFHVFLAILCCILMVYPLMIYSAISSALFFIICNRLIKNGRYATSVLMAIGEVMLCSLFATFCLGNECGFSMYNIALISAFFYLTFVIESFQKRESIAFLLSMLAIIGYITNYVLSHMINPLYALPSENMIHLLNGINHFIAFFMIIAFNFLFIWEIKVNQNTLATQNKQLDIMANHDPLTHLLNRRCMNEHLAESMRDLKLKGKRFSLILCDIDDFKKVNDTYGHDAGDLVLVTVAETISESVRGDDKVCRWGGEEILILINDPIETAGMAAERIRKKVEAATMNFEGQKIKVTMTFGLCESVPGYKIENLIQQADDKLYKGKKNGKNQVVQ